MLKVAEANLMASDRAEPTQSEKIAMARKAIKGKLAIATFGEIVSVLMRSPQYRNYTIADLDWLVAPALGNRQFSLIQTPNAKSDMPKAAGVVMWASVSKEIEAQILANTGAPIQLSAEDRRSGDNIWITDAVGERRMLSAAIHNLRQKVFKAQPVRTFVRTEDGSVRIAQL
jgi:hemolysin-activating ACP:hemolysin acyltransferase